jgi:O-antigen/teichoic acid export membrane protein
LHISGLLLARGGSFIVNFLLVPVSLSYLGVTHYGIWIALSSVVGWVGMLDLGIGNGLRNRVAAALAMGDTGKARAYISTAYVYLGGGALVLTVLFECVNPYISWTRLLNASPSLAWDLQLIAGLVFGLWGLRLVLGLLFSILQADQRPAVAAGLDFLASLVAGAGIILLAAARERSFVSFSVVSVLPLVLIPAVGTVMMFQGRYKHLKPSAASVDRGLLRDLGGLGIGFFILQIAVVIQFTSANVLIAQLLSPDVVATYSVAMRYFNIPLIFFTTLLGPFWSAYTDSYVRGDMAWIQRSVRKLRRLWFMLGIFIIFMTAAAPYVYKVWVGDALHVSVWLSVALAVYVLMQTWCAIYVNLINGTGFIRLEVTLAVVTTLIFIPLAIGGTSWIYPGEAGIVAAMCLLLVPSCILWPIQVSKILTRRNIGIWGK